VQPTGLPFNVLAILPDSTGGGKWYFGCNDQRASERNEQ
jgi:hypothetical protein